MPSARPHVRSSVWRNGAAELWSGGGRGGAGSVRQVEGDTEPGAVLVGEGVAGPCGLGEVVAGIPPFAQAPPLQAPRGALRGLTHVATPFF